MFHFVVLCLLSVVACATAPAPVTSTGAVDGETFEGTIGIVEVARSGPVATMRLVQATAEAGFDRVTFTFDEGAVLPGYHLEYIDKPAHDCGSGEAKLVAGEAWLEVRFYPANAHTEAGEPTIPFREQPLELPLLRELARTCDFEAVTTWVIGSAAPTAYRVQELTSPPRLLVDLTHTRATPR